MTMLLLWSLNFQNFRKTLILSIHNVFDTVIKKINISTLKSQSLKCASHIWLAHLQIKSNYKYIITEKGVTPEIGPKNEVGLKRKKTVLLSQEVRLPAQHQRMSIQRNCC